MLSKPMAPSLVGIGPTWLDRRQMGLKNSLGTRSHIYKQMYSNILPYGSWDHTFNNTYTSVHGAVFCLEFSPEGSLLVAACEKKSVLMFDPLTHKRIHSVENAHSDCVNCVKFLDSRSFATCSDDFTVALWDARNLSQKVRLLKGHSNWVKNIEYSPQDGLLVTSGFDGSVLTWEMNTYRESGTVYNKVFSTNGLMRTCLTPDATKMVVCTTGGYLIVIHNLNLNTLSQDLDGFKPNMYRLMQLSQTILPIVSDFTDLFRGQGKRNRVEFITDFPEGDDAEVVSSLQIHPDGHCAISRNVSNNEKSEWSCIHNIEERLSSDESDFTDDDADEMEECFTVNWPGTSNSVSTTPSYIIQHSVVENQRGNRNGENGEGGGAQHNDLSVSPSDVWEALVAIQEARMRRESEGAASEMSVGHMFRRQPPTDVSVRARSTNSDRQIFVARILPNLGSNRDDEESLSPPQQNERSSFHQNVSSNVNSSSSNLALHRLENRSRSSTLFRAYHRKKLPIRQRYASLYRRSLVGLYDRTSILRKPIYNHRMLLTKVKKLKQNYKLNTNYEINETRRLQNESSTEGGSKCLPVDGANSTNPPSNRPCNSIASDPSLSVEADVRLPEERRRGGDRSVSTSSTASIDDRPRSVVGRRGETPEGVQSSSRSDQENGTVDHEEVVGGETTDERESQQSAAGSSEDGRTILMGVFRAENRNGIRGTTMRKHNVATVTVSSASKSSASSASGDNLERRKRLRNKNSARDNGHTCTRSSDFKENVRKSGNSRAENNNGGGGKVRSQTTSPVNKKIYQNTKRLTHYVEEPNLGRGFIKELCVSPDGRIICSPFGNGIRLLSFSPGVQDIFHCYPPSPPIPLHELTLNIAHSDTVVSTKFSPFHNLLVSGCLSGKIVYYQPFL